MMGWAYGKSHDGREIGYSVDGTCDKPGCEEKIDRGLAFLCGDLDQVLRNNGMGCGKYFCHSHLFFADLGGSPPIRGISLCEECGETLGTLVVEKFPMLGGKEGKRADCPVCGDDVERITQPEVDADRDLFEPSVFLVEYEELADFVLEPCMHKVEKVRWPK